MRRRSAVWLCFILVLALFAPATVYAAEAPPNDMFANATPIGALPDTRTVDISAATLQTGEPGYVAARTRSVWYTFVAPGTGAVSVEASDFSFSSPVLATYRYDPSIGGFAGLTLLVGRIATTAPATNTAYVSAGATYYVQVTDNGSGGGQLTLAFAFHEPPASDRFATATTIPSLPWNSPAPVDLAGAGNETGEPNPCGYTNLSRLRTVWYMFTASASGDVTVTASGFTGIALAAFASTGIGFGGLSGGTCTATGSLTFSVAAGGVYYVQAKNSQVTYGDLSIGFAFTVTPDNDLFASATAVTSGTIDSVDLSTASAIREPLERDPCGWGFTRSVWYRYDATASGALLVDTTGTGFSDPRLTAYYVATGPGLDGLSSGRCGPSLPVVAGRTYFLQITDAGSGGGALRVAFTFIPAPANDAIANATTIAGLPYSDTSADTRGASRETGEPSACGTYARTVWYRYAPAEGGVVTIDGIGSAFPVTVLAVYRGATTDLTGLSTVACENTGSPLVVRLAAGSTYWIQASADGTSAGGMLAFHVTSTPDAVPAPSNDLFAAATVVSAFPFVDTVDLTRATLEAGEQTAGCGNYFAGSVWYTFVAPADGAITLEGSNATGTVLLNAYRQGGTGLSGLSTLGYNACTGTFPVQAGVRYFIQAASAKYTTPGSIEIHLSQVPRPVNDDLASAKVVTGGSLVNSADVRAATSEPGEPHQCGGTSRTVWYAITAPTMGTVRVGAGGWDPVIGVYRTSGPGFAGLTPITCTYTQDAPLTFTATGGATYYIQMSDWYTEGNVFEIHITFVDTTPPAISIAGAAASYAVDARIAIAGRATDLVDPAPVIACSLAGPGSAAAAVPCAYSADAWSLGALGTYTFTATAADAAGNAAAASASFDIVATYPSVANLTKLSTKKATVAKDLVAILDSAASAEKRGQLTAEANKIAEFRAAVKAQSGKAIDADKAALLIAFSYGL